MNDFTKEERDIVVSTIASSKNISTEIFTKLTRELLEDRTCSTCNWYHKEVCCEDSSPLCADFVSEDFGCKLWEERKDKK